jgi:hypothetical protein
VSILATHLFFRKAAALDLARAGFVLFPTGLDKRPLECGWQDAATTDPRQIKRWWTVKPWANLGCRTGAAANLVVLDVDPRHGGDASLAALIAKQHDALWLETVCSRTASGGRHFFFSHPGSKIRNSVSVIGDGLDIRGEGGYVLLPPSSREDGESYQWLRPPSCGMRELPGWLVDKLKPPPPPPAPAQPIGGICGHTPDDPYAALWFSPHWPQRYVQVAVATLAYQMTTAREGTRNATLNKVAFAAGQLVGGGAIPARAIAAQIHRAALDAGLEPREIQVTFASGFEAGLRNPRLPPSPARGEHK